MAFRPKHKSEWQLFKASQRKPHQAAPQAERNALGMTAKQYMGAVASLGCILCRHLGYPGTPAQVHHPRLAEFGAAAGRRASDFFTIPLCPEHHQGKHGVHGITDHDAFAAHWGVHERELVRWTYELVAASVKR